MERHNTQKNIHIRLSKKLINKLCKLFNNVRSEQEPLLHKKNK